MVSIPQANSYWLWHALKVSWLFTFDLKTSTFLCVKSLGQGYSIHKCLIGAWTLDQLVSSKRYIFSRSNALFALFSDTDPIAALPVQNVSWTKKVLTMNLATPLAHLPQWSSSRWWHCFSLNGHQLVRSSSPMSFLQVNPVPPNASYCLCSTWLSCCSKDRFLVNRFFFCKSFFLSLNYQDSRMSQHDSYLSHSPISLRVWYFIRESI